MASYIKKRSVKLWGHPTSVSVEDEFWKALALIAKREKTSIAFLLHEIDRQRVDLPSLAPSNLSSSIRVYVLNYFLNNT